MPGIHTTTFVLAVLDLAASVSWYKTALGMTDDGIDAPGWAFLSRDGFHVRLGECPDETPATELGNHSFFAYLHVSDAPALHEEIAANGAEIIAPLQDKPWGVREFAVRTVDGHRILFGEILA